MINTQPQKKFLTFHKMMFNKMKINYKRGRNLKKNISKKDNLKSKKDRLIINRKNNRLAIMKRQKKAKNLKRNILRTLILPMKTPKSGSIKKNKN